jgi:hypothetical protein
LLNVQLASNLTLDSNERAHVRALAAISLVYATPACSDSTAVMPPRGSLEVTIAGFPAGQPAAVTVTGPGNTSEQLTATATMSDLRRLLTWSDPRAEERVEEHQLIVVSFVRPVPWNWPLMRRRPR